MRAGVSPHHPPQGSPGRATRTPRVSSPSPAAEKGVAESARGSAADSLPRARGPDSAVHDRAARPAARGPSRGEPSILGGHAPCRQGQREVRGRGEARLKEEHGAVSPLRLQGPRRTR